MKKFLLTIASVLLASMASAQVSVQHQNLDVVVSNPSASQQSQAVKKVAKIAENQRWLGYYNSDNWAGEGLGMGVPSYPGDNQVAIYLTKDILKSYVGMKIVGMRFAICEEIGSTTAFFKKVENDAPGADLRTKELSTTALGWNEVMFSEPVEITGDEEFAAGYTYTQIGDQYNGKAFPFSAVKEGIDNQYLFIYCLDPKTGDTGWKKFSMGGKNMSIQVLVEGEFPEYSAMPEDFGMVTGSINTDAKITVPFVNNSAYAVTDLDYVVSVDGVAGSEEHTTFSPSVGVGSKSSFKVSVPCGSVEAKKSIKVEITKVNGHDNESKDKVAEGYVGVSSTQFTRNMVIEEFTTEKCPNCPRVAGYLHEYLEGADLSRVAAVCHHSAYYTDWLTTKRSVVNGEYIKTDLYDYASLYNDRGTYAPAMMFGRNAWFDAMSTAGNKCCTYMPGSAMEIESLIQQIQSDPANIIITNLSARYGDNDTTIVVRVEGMRNSSAKDGSRITVMLTEDNIAAHAQMGAEGSFTHQHVTRAINSIWGEPIEWDGNKFSYEVSLGLNTVYFTKNDKVQAGNFEEAWRMWNRDNLNIVAFVNYYSKNVEGCAVENVEGVKFNDAINGIEDLPQTKESQTVRSEVYTIDGKRIEADQMGRGLYIIRDIQADGSVHTRKVMRK